MIQNTNSDFMLINAFAVSEQERAQTTSQTVLEKHHNATQEKVCINQPKTTIFTKKGLCNPFEHSYT